MEYDLSTLTYENFIYNELKPNPDFTYERLTSKHLDEVVNVFTTAFCFSEPMTAYLKLDPEKYKAFTYAVTEQAIKDELSVVALHQGHAVACALIEDIASPGELPEFDPKFDYILALLEELSGPFFEGKTFDKGHIAHLFITAVHHEYRQLGLSTQVNFHAMELAAQHGFEFMCSELTNIYNEQGLIPHLRNPQKMLGSIRYQEFMHNGIKPFANLKGGANAFLWEIQKNALLQYKQDGTLICTKL